MRNGCAQVKHFLFKIKSFLCDAVKPQLGRGSTAAGLDAGLLREGYRATVATAKCHLKPRMGENAGQSELR